MSGARILGSCQGAVCIPTRACLHTGVNHFRNAPQDNGRPGMVLRPELPLLVENFRNAGYQTFGTGKWHNDEASFNRSFEDGQSIFFGGMADHFATPLWDYDSEGLYRKEDAHVEARHSTENFCDAAVNFINECDKEKPFFTYLALTSPHDPRTSTKDFHDRYPSESIELPRNFQTQHPIDNGDLFVRDECLASHPRKEEEIKEHIADYYAMISHHDSELSRVYRSLEEKGVLDNTIIVYMADHGLAVGQHGLMGKQNVYDHSIRVPLILKGPNIPQGKQHSELVYSYDIHPTLLQLCGLDTPASIEAESFYSALQGEAFEARETVYTNYCERQATVTDGNYKLIQYYTPTADGLNLKPAEQQLFDLQVDPYETTNLAQAPDQSAVLSRLEQAMRTWQTKLGDPIAAKVI